MLLLFLSCRQAHLLPLLLVHNFSDSALSFSIKIIYLFRVIDLGGVNLLITLDEALPDAFLGLLEGHNQ